MLVLRFITPLSIAGAQILTERNLLTSPSCPETAPVFTLQHFSTSAHGFCLYRQARHLCRPAARPPGRSRSDLRVHKSRRQVYSLGRQQCKGRTAPPLAQHGRSTQCSQKQAASLSLNVSEDGVPQQKWLLFTSLPTAFSCFRWAPVTETTPFCGAHLTSASASHFHILISETT